MSFEDEVVITSRNAVYSKDKVPTGIFGQRVVIPEFQIYSNPTVRISDIKARRFSLIERGELYDNDDVVVSSSNEVGQKSKLTPVWMNRAVQKARMEIMAQEDANIFAALDAIVAAEKK